MLWHKRVHNQVTDNRLNNATVANWEELDEPRDVLRMRDKCERHLIGLVFVKVQVTLDSETPLNNNLEMC